MNFPAIPCILFGLIFVSAPNGGGEYRPITGAVKYRSNILHCAVFAPVFVFDDPGFALRINWGVGVHGLQYPDQTETHSPMIVSLTCCFKVSTSM